MFPLKQSKKQAAKQIYDYCKTAKNVTDVMRFIRTKFEVEG